MHCTDAPTIPIRRVSCGKMSNLPIASALLLLLFAGCSINICTLINVGCTVLCCKRALKRGPSGLHIQTSAFSKRTSFQINQISLHLSLIKSVHRYLQVVSIINVHFLIHRKDGGSMVILTMWRKWHAKWFPQGSFLLTGWYSFLSCWLRSTRLNTGLRVPRGPLGGLSRPLCLYSPVRQNFPLSRCWL